MNRASPITMARSRTGLLTRIRTSLRIRLRTRNRTSPRTRVRTGLTAEAKTATNSKLWAWDRGQTPCPNFCLHLQQQESCAGQYSEEYKVVYCKDKNIFSLAWVRCGAVTAV